MSDRLFTLYICDCDGRQWTRDELNMDCWLCKSKVRQVEARVEEDQPTFDPAQGKLL